MIEIESSKPFRLPIFVLAFAAAGALVPRPAAAEKTSERWALLIGVNDYSELTDLKYACADVRALKQELVARGFPEKQVFLLEDQARESKYRPSKGNIEKQLKLVLGLVEPDDVLLLAFSGHGVHLRNANYFCPSDASLDEVETLISQEVLYEQLRNCKASLKLLLIDACRDDPRLQGNKAAGAPDLTAPFASALDQRPPNGVVLLNSCGKGEVSKEDKDLDGGHGVFMYFILRGLRGDPDADADHDRRVMLGELSRYAARETKAHVARKFNGFQRPYMRLDAAIEAEDFALASAVRAPGTPRPVEPDGKTETNTLGMKLALIAPGEFQMGSDESMAELEQAFGKLPDKFTNADEHPQHLVRITTPFYMGVHEVTKGQFRKFVEDADYKTDAEKDGKGGWGWSEKDKKFEQKPEYTWQSWGFEQGDDHPVVNVSWNDATAFCGWLGTKEGKEYRLPTEAEWEYACRAGTDTRFYNGDDPEGLAKIGNVADGTAKEKFTWWSFVVKAKDGYAFTSPVGRFRPNKFALYDMTGNAWEWCSDRYDADYYGKSPADDPQGPATAGSFRVIRGGGWNNNPVNCRSANHDNDEPANRNNNTGFRVVRAR